MQRLVSGILALAPVGVFALAVPLAARLGIGAAAAVAVSVATGPVGAEELRAAGADVVLPDLLGFPAWLAGYLAP